jgi:hypothetical protein
MNQQPNVVHEASAVNEVTALWFCDYIPAADVRDRAVAARLDALEAEPDVEIADNTSRENVLGWRITTQNFHVAKRYHLPWQVASKYGPDWCCSDLHNGEKADYSGGATTYHRTWATGYTWIYQEDFDAVKAPADLTPILSSILDDVAQVLAVCTTPGVTLDDVSYDKRDGFLFSFSTTDPEIAQRLEFDEMFRDGAEDFEPAPWAVQS